MIVYRRALTCEVCAGMDSPTIADGILNQNVYNYLYRYIDSVSVVF